jgi:hypothetical protein
MRLATGVAFAALAGLAGCGEGLRDGTGDAFVTRMAAPGEVNVTLAQGRFHANKMTQAATISMRRLPEGTLPHEIGPVFELSIDGMTAFNSGLPYFEMTLPANGEPDGAVLRLAIYKGGTSDSGWTPLVSNYVYDAVAHTVRGDINVPSLSGGVKLQIAAVIWCGRDGVMTCPWEPYYCGQQGVCQ